jgi:RNA polymerase sigma-70 factor (ECF subfamily)
MKTEVINSKTQFTNLHQNLIDLCKAGNQRAQFQIYKLYYKAMYNISLRIVNNPMEAEDIMQESFLSAFEKLDTYSGSVSFGAWIKRIVINRSLDAVKKERKVIFEDIDSFQEPGVEYVDDTSCNEETNLKVQEVMDAIKMLPDGYRIVISLYLLEGYDHEEIAEILSISPVTSRSQFSRAKQKLITTLSRN